MSPRLTGGGLAQLTTICRDRAETRIVKRLEDQYELAQQTGPSRRE